MRVLIACMKGGGEAGTGRSEVWGTYALASELWNWLAMLRWVKSVPGFALKTVPSLTRLSEHPMNMNGGAGGACAGQSPGRLIQSVTYLVPRPLKFEGAWGRPSQCSL